MRYVVSSLHGGFRFAGRSFLTISWLLLSFVLPLHAQRGLELSGSVGASLTKPVFTRFDLPANFKTTSNFHAGAALRLTIPVNKRLGVGVEHRVTGLTQTFRYEYQQGRRSSGSLPPSALQQSGVSLRFYDVLRPGPRWTLDAAITAACGWTTANSSSAPYQLLGENASSVPRAGAPQVRVQSIQLQQAIATAGTELLLAYELSARQSLLLTASYQRGLQRNFETRSVQVDYLDEAGVAQQGSFIISTRCSYGTVQLGYGLRLGQIEARTRRTSTPRYSIDTPVDEDLPDAESPID